MTLNILPDTYDLNTYLMSLDNGTVKQIGGSVKINDALYLGYSPGSDDIPGDGTYELNAGTLTLYGYVNEEEENAATEYIGFQGIGSFTHKGGTNTADIIHIGYEGGIGTYKLKGSGEIYTSVMQLGEFGGIGSFIQDGGTNNVSVILYVGRGDSEATGSSYFFKKGILTVNNERIGEGGKGTFIQWDGTNTADILSLGSYAGDATFTQKGGTTIVNDTLFIAEDTEDKGTYNLQGGFLSSEIIINNDKFIYSGGELEARYYIANAGFFQGQGDIDTPEFINDGIVSPGNSPGKLSISGDYYQNDTGTLYIELGGTEQGSTYDWLNIGGDANLNGNLEVVLWGENEDSIFSPSDGDTFDILTALAIYDEFDSFNLPTLSEGLSWKIVYLDIDNNDIKDTVRLTASAVPIPGALWLLGSGVAAIIGVRRKGLR